MSAAVRFRPVRPEQTILRRWLKHLGWSHQDLALRLDVAKKFVDGKLNQPSAIGTDNLMRLVSGLGLPGPPELQMARFWLGPDPSMEELERLEVGLTPRETAALRKTIQELQRQLKIAERERDDLTRKVDAFLKTLG